MSNYLSSIKLPNGDTYEFKDSVARAYHEPIATKTYTDIIATSNDNVGGAFFYLKVRANNWTDKWHIKTKVFATVPGNDLYETETYFDIWGYENTYGGYICKNYVRSTSYRPIYYNNYFRVAKTGYDNGCGGWIGFSLYNSTNPLNTSLKRTVTIDLLEYENCTVDFQDSLITPTNIPERAAHTNYYSSTNTSFDNLDAAGQGIKSSGDNNTTSISNLYHNYGNFIANSVIYRYQLLFHVNDDKLTPLNNDNNVTATTKTLLTNLEFYPFKDIFWFYSTGTVNANAAISAGSCFYSMNSVDLRYTFNITSSTLTAHKNVYLKLTPTSGFLAKLASASPITQDLPASEDGYLYLLLGRAYSGYQISLYPKHPVYYYYNDRIVELQLKNTKNTVYYDDEREAISLTGNLELNEGLKFPTRKQGIEFTAKNLSDDTNETRKAYIYWNRYSSAEAASRNTGDLIISTNNSNDNIIFKSGLNPSNTSTITPNLHITNNKVYINENLNDPEQAIYGINNLKFKVTGDSYFNGAIKANTYVGLPTASTSTAGIVQLNNDITSNSTSTAPTSNVIKKLYDALEGLEIKKNYINNFISAKDTVNENINNLIIYGKSIQEGTPTISNPIEIKNVGMSNTLSIINNNGNLADMSCLAISASNNASSNVSTYADVTATSNDGVVSFAGTATDNAIFRGNILTLPPGTYNLSGCPGTGGTSSYRIEVRDLSSVALTNDSGSGGSFTLTSITQCRVTIRIANGYNSTGLSIKPVLNFSNNINTDTCNINTVTLSLANELCGIPVESGGNYTDTTGQQWICDTIDLFNKKYIKRIGVINSSGYTATYSANTDFIAMKISEEKLLSENYVEQLSNYGTYVPTVSRVSANENTFKLHIPPSNGFTYLYIHKPSTITSQAILDEWLGTHNIIVYYALLSPVTTNLTTEQITALQNLHSYNNITNIFTTDECQPEIETSLYTSFSVE